MKEHESQTNERGVEIAHDAHERSRELGEKLKRNPERYDDKEAHQTAQEARQNALKEALFSKEQGKEKRTHQADRHNSIITREDRDVSYDQTMERVRRELPRSTRTFSKFIHSPVIEKSSEVIGNTFARPNSILAGGISAFVIVLGLYSYARYAGFSLQGSETIAAFLIGWLLGILFDFFRVMLTGKK